MILAGGSAAVDRVYGGGRREAVAAEFNLFPEVVTRKTIASQLPALETVAYIFSTWGMFVLSDDQFEQLPNLRGVFYAAGSVQGFARPYLERGITVVSAWGANGVPVADFTLAQILLSTKGFWPSQCLTRSCAGRARRNRDTCPGNYEVDVALLGAGMIGSLVIERLRPFDIRVLVFDPFLSEERATELGVEKVGLEEAFRRGCVVSNHLANLPATERMLTGELFASMQPHATFINTGRGMTVEEDRMIEVLRERPDLTALLDVTSPEPPEEGSPLYTLPNVVLSPHLAGSTGQEVWRMVDYVLAEARAFRDGRPLKYAVTLDMLDTMA